MAFVLEVKGKQVSIPEEDTWIRDDGTRVVKAHRLEMIAEAQGEVVPSPKLEFVLDVGGELFVTYRCEGLDSQKRMISAVGEASPLNCPNEVAGAYPVSMAFLRAKVRWITAALNLAGQVYADVEFANKGNGEGEEVSSAEEKEPAEVALSFGKYKGKTIEEVFKLDPAYILWLKDNYEPRNRQGKSVKEAVEAFYPHILSNDDNSRRVIRRTGERKGF